MKFLKLVSISLPLVLLTGCSTGDLVSAAADAAACRAAESTIAAAAQAYEQGLIDSGILDQLNALIGDSVQGVLSSGLAKDLGDLLVALGETDSAQSSKDKVAQLSASIATRCEAVGVTFSN